MNFLSLYSFEIKTRKSPEGIIAKLNGSVEAKRFHPLVRPTKAFEGVITETGFKIERTTQYNTPFLPVIVGKFVSNPAGTTILIRMRFHAFLLIFTPIWLCFAVLSGLLQSCPFNGILFSIVFVVVAYGMFSWEATKAQQLLEGLFGKNGIL